MLGGVGDVRIWQGCGREGYLVRSWSVHAREDRCGAVPAGEDRCAAVLARDGTTGGAGDGVCFDDAGLDGWRGECCGGKQGCKDAVGFHLR